MGQGHGERGHGAEDRATEHTRQRTGIGDGKENRGQGTGDSGRWLKHRTLMSFFSLVLMNKEFHDRTRKVQDLDKEMAEAGAAEKDSYTVDHGSFF